MRYNKTTHKSTDILSLQMQRNLLVMIFFTGIMFSGNLLFAQQVQSSKIPAGKAEKRIHGERVRKYSNKRITGQSPREIKKNDAHGSQSSRPDTNNNVRSLGNYDQQKKRSSRKSSPVN